MTLRHGYNRSDGSGSKTSLADGLRKWEVLRVLFDDIAVDPLATAKQVAKIAVLCTGLILLSACAKRLRLPLKPLSPQQTAAAFEERTLENSGLKHYVEASLTRGSVDWPPAQWDLSKLTLVAFYYHPSLDAARAQWVEAQEAVNTAGARPNPTIGLNVRHLIPVEAGISPWALLPSFDLPIETAGKRGYRLVQARELSEAARLNIGGVGWQVRSQVRSQLVDHLLTLRDLEVIREEERVRSEYVQALETKLEFGDISQFDLAMPRLELQRVRLSVAPVAGRVEETRAALAGALGLPPAALARATVVHNRLDSPPALDDLATLESEALLNRLDIRRGLSDHRASEAALQLELARQVPDIQIGTGFRWRSTDRRWDAGLSLPIPLLNRNEGPIGEALARREQAAIRIVELQASIINSLARAAARYRAALAERETARDLLAAAEARERNIVQLFELGDVDRTVLLEAQLEILLARRGGLVALRRAQVELGALEDAVQKPLEPGSSLPAVPERGARQ